MSPLGAVFAHSVAMPMIVKPSLKTLSFLFGFICSVTIVLSSNPAQSAPNLCSNLFDGSERARLSYNLNEYDEALSPSMPDGLRRLTVGESIPDTSVLGQLLYRLAEANFRAINGTGAVDFSFSKVTIKKTGEHPKFPLFQAEIIGRVALESGAVLNDFEFTAIFRSNGRAAFVADTFKNHQRHSYNSDFSFSYIDSAGTIKLGSQGWAILNSLAPEIRLSRVMLDSEAELWKSGQSADVKSSFEHNGTHFAVNKYLLPLKDASNAHVYYARIPKRILQKLFEERLLVLNTYQSSTYSRWGMPPEASTPFGLEFEIVVIGNNGRKAINPWMVNLEMGEAAPVTSRDMGQ